MSKFFNINRLRTKTNRLLFFMAADIVFIFLSVWIAFWLRFDSLIPPQYFPVIWKVAFLAVIFIIPIFYFQKLYSFSWSFVSINEAIRLFEATTISFVFLGVVIYVSKYFPEFKNFPRSILVISYIFVLASSAALRFSKKFYHHIFGFKRALKQERTLIVGAGDTGEQIVRNILSFKDSPYHLVGFVDDNPIKFGIKIHGLKVFGRIANIPEVVARKSVKQLIVALPSHSNRAIKQAVELARESGLRKVKITPHFSEIMRGKASLRNLIDIDAGDLLGRNQVDLDKKQIEHFIKRKKIFITGAAGSIGSELSMQIAKFNPSALFLLDQDETGIFNISNELRYHFSDLKVVSIVSDIRDEKVISNIFKGHKPEIIFHAAAYKHVPLMEAQPDEAIKNNVFGTEILVKSSLESQAEKFIFISTDKAVNPTSVMGMTKRIGEMICQANNKNGKTKFMSVRFGNVLDSRGSVIPIFKEQIRKGGPVQVTDPKMERYFMLVSEACLLVMQAGAMGQGGEIFVLDMGKPIKILDLAKEMIRSSGLEPDRDIAIVFTGSRPGEKLFEEILTSQEGAISAKNQKIFITASNLNPKFNLKLEKLKNSLINHNEHDLIKELRIIVS